MSGAGTPVGSALQGLTTRGRCLLAAGITLSTWGVALGERDLLRAGLFLAVLPLAAVGVVAQTRYQLSCRRRLDPARVEVGRVATVRLRLDNLSRLPSGVLLMEDTLPYMLGGRPRFVLDRVEPRGKRDVSYPVRADSRGRFRIGPLAVRLTDPFGLCELTRSFATSDDLIVTPVLSALPAVRLGGDWTGGGEARSRTVAASGADDAATREYRSGDDLRKVHWRSTARVGELMVRREEQPVQSRATILLDGRQEAHRGDGPGSSFEYAISAAASIACSLAGAGFRLQLVTEAGADVGPAQVPLTASIVLEALALATPSRLPTLAAAASRLRGQVDGVLIAILGAVDAEDTERLARLRAGTGTGVAVVLDVDSWAPISVRQRDAARQAADRSAALLSAAGWRVVPVSFGTTLASVWGRAGFPSSRPGIPA